VGNSRDLPRDVGEFIRDLRNNARISLRQLAAQAGVSNPYLSQIERGLRKPSAEVLAQLAGALRVSTPLMYLRAGLLDAKEGQGVLAAIAADTELTMAQKQSLTQIYETFRRENARETTQTGHDEQVSAPVPQVADSPPPAAGRRGASARGPRERSGRDTGSGRTAKKHPKDSAPTVTGGPGATDMEKESR